RNARSCGAVIAPGEAGVAERHGGRSLQRRALPKSSLIYICPGGRPMCIVSRKKLVVVTLVVTAIVVASLSPSYTYVRISGPYGETIVEKAAVGAQHVHVEGPGGTVVECEVR